MMGSLAVSALQNLFLYDSLKEKQCVVYRHNGGEIIDLESYVESALS